MKPLKLRPFQRRAVKALESGRYHTVVMSLPRSQGKSTLAAELCWRALTPGDALFVEGAESHLVAATISSARKTCFKQLRRRVETSKHAEDYSISESLNQVHVRHTPTNTRVSVVAATQKATLGLVGTPYCFVDEPGAFDVTAGEDLWASLRTALGKPESPLKLFIIGHLAPNATAPGHWYYDLVHRGTRGRTWVHFVQGRRDRWDKASELRRVSPLSWHYKASREEVYEERDEARHDSRLLADFLSYRLNLPSADEAKALLTVADWERMCERPVPEPEGRPIVGLDLGGGRAFSAATAVWLNGRVECLAVAPGIPDIRAQEKRDQVPKFTYQALVDAGVLHVAEGLYVPSVKQLLGLVAPWHPRVLLADYFNDKVLLDAGARNVRFRRPRWKESTQDIRGLRKLALDGTLVVVPECRGLM